MALSEETTCQESVGFSLFRSKQPSPTDSWTEVGGVAYWNEAKTPISLLQDVTRNHQVGGDVLRPFSGDCRCDRNLPLYSHQFTITLIGNVIFTVDAISS